ncbi:hypothetical protein [Myroides indicus]|uniref:Lipoprotein n=1 Tax=Myroides indicus TaxID=1323422 RepID=A0A4R7EZD0_9FLAO|nr:hypothetical protein [Myroides indicus]TDS55239.1 hypothetical protein C8P70_12310 [Myroides indicus]
MKNNKIIIVCAICVAILGVYSCDRESKTDSKYDIQLDNMFYALGQDVEKECVFFKEDLQRKEKSIIDKENHQFYFQVNKDMNVYYNYLVEIDSLSLSHKENLFFTDNEINVQGKLFLKKSAAFNTQIINIIKDESIRQKVNLLLSVDDVKSEENIYFNYLDYYYNGAPYKTFNFLIKNRKRNILLIKNEIICFLNNE